MPTGYTDMIKKGVTFKKFAMRSARAMGACVTMRDDPCDAEIPIFKVSSYDKNKLKEATSKLKILKKTSIEDATAKATKEFNEKVLYNEIQISKNNILLGQYHRMLEKVKAWQPPSSDHTHFKNFMTEQITGSIKFDCSNSYYLDNTPKLLTGEAWLEKETKQSLRDIDYYTKEHEKEVERVNGRNTWIKQLKDSL